MLGMIKADHRRARASTRSDEVRPYIAQTTAKQDITIRDRIDDLTKDGICREGGLIRRELAFLDGCSSFCKKPHGFIMPPSIAVLCHFLS